jgi:hypothetical protein
MTTVSFVLFYFVNALQKQGKSKDTIWVIGSRKSQDRKYNGKEKLAQNDKQWSSIMIHRKLPRAMIY